MDKKMSELAFGLTGLICLILGGLAASVLFVQPEVLAEYSFFQTYLANGIGGTTGHGAWFMAGMSVFFGLILIGGVRFHKKFSPGLFAASVLFGITEPSALVMEAMQDLLPWFTKPHFLIWFFAAFLSASLLLYAFGTVLLKGLTRLSRTRRDSDTFWDRHIGLLSFLILFSVFFVWILAFYPGSMCFDMCYQLLEYYGAEELTTHHPVFSTLIMGGLMDVGRALFGNDNSGLFLYVLFQGLFLSFAYSRAVVWMNRCRFHRAAELLTLLFFAVVPAFGALSQYATKDPVSYGWMVLLTLSFVRVYETADKGRQLQARDAVSLTLSALFGCLYRKEVVLITLICFAAVLFFALMKRQWKRMAMLGISVCIVVSGYAGFNLFALRVLGAKEGGGYGSGEMLSVPLQQVARFVYKEEEKLDPEDNTLAEACFTGGTEGLKESYNPYLSDFVKEQYTGDFGALSALWGRLFVKDARPFAESLFANSFAYYAMVPRLDPNPLGTKYNGNPGERDWFYINTDADAGREILQVAYPENTAPLRTALERWCAVWRRLPGLNLLTDCGTYTWILILLWIIATKQKKGFLFLGMALPPVLMVFVCIASPVNDCMRYYFSIPATIFTCIAACGSLIRNEDPAPDAHSKTIPDPSGSAMKTPQTPSGPAQKCPDDR